MNTTLSDMPAKKKPEPSAEETAAKELVRLAQEQGLSLTGPDGLVNSSPRDGRRLCLNPNGTAAYLVDNTNPENVERWPAAKERVACA